MVTESNTVSGELLVAAAEEEKEDEVDGVGGAMVLVDWMMKNGNGKNYEMIMMKQDKQEEDEHTHLHLHHEGAGMCNVTLHITNG